MPAQSISGRPRGLTPVHYLIQYTHKGMKLEARLTPVHYLIPSRKKSCHLAALFFSLFRYPGDLGDFRTVRLISADAVR